MDKTIELVAKFSETKRYRPTDPHEMWLPQDMEVLHPNNGEKSIAATKIANRLEPSYNSIKR